VEVAPNQDAASERNTRNAGRLREARKKSSRLRILLENRKLTPKIKTKYPVRKIRKVMSIKSYNRNPLTLAIAKTGARKKK
jgi:hypothetical protein